MNACSVGGEAPLGPLGGVLEAHAQLLQPAANVVRQGKLLAGPKLLAHFRQQLQERARGLFGPCVLRFQPKAEDSGKLSQALLGVRSGQLPLLPSAVDVAGQREHCGKGLRRVQVVVHSGDEALAVCLRVNGLIGRVTAR